MTRKLIDAEAAKAAIQSRINELRYARHGADQAVTALVKIRLALDALPDASEQAIHTERIPVPPHLAEAQRVVIKQAQQAGDGAEE